MSSTCLGGIEGDETMKPMKYKSSDLGMWHHFAEVAEQMKFVAKTEEHHLIGECDYYSWDNEAFEENCNCEQIKRKKDFDSDKECFKCSYYLPTNSKKQTSSGKAIEK